jgi:hypothetical protein
MRKFFNEQRGWIEPCASGFLVTSFLLLFPQIAQPVF